MILLSKIQDLSTKIWWWAQLQNPNPNAHTLTILYPGFSADVLSEFLEKTKHIYDRLIFGNFETFLEIFTTKIIVTIKSENKRNQK